MVLKNNRYIVRSYKPTKNIYENMETEGNESEDGKSDSSASEVPSEWHNLYNTQDMPT